VPIFGTPCIHESFAPKIIKHRFRERQIWAYQNSRVFETEYRPVGFGDKINIVHIYVALHILAMKSVYSRYSFNLQRYVL